MNIKTYSVVSGILFFMFPAAILAVHAETKLGAAGWIVSGAIACALRHWMFTHPVKRK